MVTSPEQAAAEPSSVVGNVMAGVLTALIFYAEYISLGATLGGHLDGAGKSAQALGSMLVIGAVLMCCLSSLCWRLPIPLLAGPRAASLLLLLAGMDWARSHTADALVLPATTATLVIGLMLVVAAGVQLLGRIKVVRVRVQAADKALTRGFMFVTAAGIVGGMVDKQLAACLQLDFWATLAIFGASVAAASGWMKWCEAGSHARKRFKAASIFIGMGLAWAGYAVFLPGASSANGCGTLGTVGLEWQALAVRLPGWSQAASAVQGLGLRDWAVVALLGVAMGAVQLIETMTALEGTRDIGQHPDLWPRYLAASATANLLCAPLGLAGSAWSGSRSTALAQAYGTSRVAVAVHGLSLVAIALLAGGLVARVPLLAIAVALTMVAVQMIDEKTEKDVWQPGYQPTAKPAKVKATWLFWGVVGVGFFSGQAIAGLMAGALATVFYRFGLRRFSPTPHPARS